MRKNRIIPIVLFKDGHVVQSKKFREYKNLGNPLLTINRLSEWGADEICFLDISRDNNWQGGRSDLNERTPATFLEVLAEVSKVAYMPLTCGGGIRTMEDVELRIKNGADKISLNSAIFCNPALIQDAIKEYGSQSVVASVDVKFVGDKYKVYIHGGQTCIDQDWKDYLRRVEDLEVGEILLNSINNDGGKEGYDLSMLSIATSLVSIPVIACGGVGEWEHFRSALTETEIDAVAAANIFQHQDQSVYQAHKFLFVHGINVRPPRLLETNYLKVTTNELL